MKLGDIGEFGLIDKIKQLAGKPGQQLVLGINDDAAAFQTKPNKLTLVSTDAFVEGIHFKLDYFSFYQLGWRCLAANLSDIAAMSGQPQYALVSLALPESIRVEEIENFYLGMQALAERHQTVIIGGDTTASPEKLFISIAIIGQVHPDKMTRRSDAKVGDVIFVTGYPGLSAVGYEVLNSADEKDGFPAAIKRHLLPEPRVREAGFLVENFSIHAMIDISDGIASEIHHICKQSKTGALIDAENILLHKEIRSFAEREQKPFVDFPLYGGEDFELLFTASPETSDEIILTLEKEFELVCTQIGRIHQMDFGVKMKGDKGSENTLLSGGYDHFHPQE